ncbi:MAG: hypothetical protein CVU46_02700 [Chloroflexi bacterium HGW-Chloroflexi-8]|jgi:uncharacterized membrane protein YesL|nr:MAG: hypothetical protein CVU46_02700 [Chloroflexi bacterium HGW-Chloroflexi-8]
MDASVKTLWSVIKDFYPNLARVVLLNIFWFICSLPIITIPAAYGGLAYAIRILIYDETEFNFRQFFIGFKKSFLWTWRWFLPNIAAVLILLINILFFNTDNSTMNLFVRAGNVVLLLIWLFLQTFTFPFLFVQEKPKMITALRNSFAVLVHSPWLFFITSVFTVTIALMSIVLMIPWIFISVGFCMFISIGMLRKALEMMEESKSDQDGEKSNQAINSTNKRE